MKKCQLLLFAFLLNVGNIFAQGEFIIELDQETANFTKIGGPIPGVYWVYQNVRAYDEVNGRFIFQGGSPTPNRLNTVNVSDGSLVSNPLFPTSGSQLSVCEPQFDNVNGILYGLHIDPIQQPPYFLVKIDQNTGVHTAVGNTPISGLVSTQLGLDSYDETHQRYLICSNGRIFSVNALNGTSLGNPFLSIQPDDQMINICYNNANDTLYGLQFKNSTQSFFLVWINPATGVVTEIGNGTYDGALLGSATIDEVNRRFIYTSILPGQTRLAVMDLVTGAVLFENQIPLDNDDNVLSIKYDNVRKKLFAIHWDDHIDPSGISTIKNGIAKIYPNPASTELSICFIKNYPNVCVQLFNASGQKVRSFEIKDVNEFTVPLEGLSFGYYYINVNADKENFTSLFIKN